MFERWARARARASEEGVRVRSILQYGREVAQSGHIPRPSPQGLIFSAIHGSSMFETFHRRPKAGALGPSFEQPFDTSETAIVIQGPIELRSDFTLETIRHYRQAFPRSPLIVSTWESEPVDVLQVFEDIDVQIIVNSDIPNPGPSNVNRQITTTMAGIKAADAIGARWVWKTRTDQRAYSPFAIPLFQEAIRAFPPSQDCPTVGARLLVPSHNTFRNRLYGASDQMQFGCVTDLERYWSGEIQATETDTEKPPISGVIARDQAPGSPETLLNSRYLSRSGWRLRNSAQDSLCALASVYCVIDASSIDLFWPKYTRKEYRWRTYGGHSTFEEVSFAEWIALCGADGSRASEAKPQVRGM